MKSLKQETSLLCGEVVHSEIKQEGAVAGNGAMAYLWRIVKVEKGCFA